MADDLVLDDPEDRGWTEEKDRQGRIWYVRRPRFCGTRPTIRVQRKEEGEARMRVLEALREQVKYGVLSKKEALRRVGALERGRALIVSEIWAAYVAGLSERSKKIAASAWVHHLAPYFAMRRWDELDANRMAEWERAERERPGRQGDELLSVKTIRNAYDLLRTAYGRAVQGGKIDAIPWIGVDGAPGYRAPRVDPHGIRLAKREACRSDEELQRLVRAALEHDKAMAANGRYSDLSARIFVIALLGLRQGEAAALGWDDLHIDAPPHDCVLRNAVVDGWRDRHPDWSRPIDDPKSGRPPFALHRAAVLILREHRDRLRDRGWYRPDGPVFPTTGGGAKGGEWRDRAEVVSPKLLRRMVRAAGLPNPDRWVTHSLRHTFATLEAVGAKSIADLRARTGHASTQVLQGYMHNTGRGLLPSGISADFGDLVTDTADEPGFEPGEAALEAIALATVEEGRAAQAARDKARREKRQADRVAFAERHGLGGVPGASYQMILGDAPNDDIRRMLDGWLPPKLTAIKRRAYSIAYLRRVREGGKGEAQRAGRLAQSAWMKNFYDALRRNAKVRGILPAGWTPPVGGRHGTQAAGEEKEG